MVHCVTVLSEGKDRCGKPEVSDSVTVLSEGKDRCGNPEVTDCVTVLSEGKDRCGKPEVSGTQCNGALRGKGQVW